MNNLHAVIFDLDGTIIDNESVWEEAFVHVAQELQVPMLKSQLHNGWIHEPGMAVEENWRRYVLDSVKARDLAQKTHLVYKELVFGMDLPAREGIVELVEECKKRDLQTALCTGSIWSVVEKELEELQLYLAFDVTTTGEEVLVGKPDPEIYTLTVSKLNLEPKECLVIEDSIAGARSAIEAGCQVIGLLSDYAPAAMFEAVGVGKTVSGFEETVGLLG